MLINCTNHRLEEWSDEQISAAEQWGEIIEYPFPDVSPYATSNEVKIRAAEIADDIAGKNPQAVIVQGEMNMNFAIVSELKKKNICTLAAVSERIVNVLKADDGSIIKTSTFRFAGFREY